MALLMTCPALLGGCSQRRPAPLGPLCVLLLFVAGCSPSAQVQDDLAAYTLVPAHAQRPLVKKAIGESNKLLRNNTEFSFTPGWEVSRGLNLVPVYLVPDEGVTGSRFIFVPDSERFVLICERPLLRFFKNHEIPDSDRPAILALLLLHEAGHLKEGEGGSAASDVLSDDLRNLNDTPSKQRESAADAFAAELVKLGLKGTDPAVFATAMKVAGSFTMHQFSVGTKGTLDRFGNQSPKAYWDLGDTHENYERRLLLMAHAISPSDASKALLDEFDSRRLESTSPKVLFQATPSE